MECVVKVPLSAVTVQKGFIEDITFERFLTLDYFSDDEGVKGDGQ